jgi:hypothetical protein
MPRNTPKSFYHPPSTTHHSVVSAFFLKDLTTPSDGSVEVRVELQSDVYR